MLTKTPGIDHLRKLSIGQLVAELTPHCWGLGLIPRKCWLKLFFCSAETGNVSYWQYIHEGIFILTVDQGVSNYTWTHPY